MLAPDQAAARTMLGTPYYMSPEICKGRPYGKATDVWALGCILYELCTLRRPFDGSNLGAITVKIMRRAAPTRTNAAGLGLMDAVTHLTPCSLEL